MCSSIDDAPVELSVWCIFPHCYLRLIEMWRGRDLVNLVSFKDFLWLVSYFLNLKESLSSLDCFKAEEIATHLAGQIFLSCLRRLPRRSQIILLQLQVSNQPIHLEHPSFSGSLTFASPLAKPESVNIFSNYMLIWCCCFDIPSLWVFFFFLMVPMYWALSHLELQSDLSYDFQYQIFNHLSHIFWVCCLHLKHSSLFPLFPPMVLESLFGKPMLFFPFMLCLFL